jgi:hypothetical protein
VRKSSSLIVLVLLATGCGALRISPQGCRTDAVWGASPTSTREITRAEVEEEKVMDVKAKEKFFVFHDREIKLRHLLEENGINCGEVKKLRVVISTSWFAWREVALKVVKK